MSSDVKKCKDKCCFSWSVKSLCFHHYTCYNLIFWLFCKLYEHFLLQLTTFKLFNFTYSVCRLERPRKAPSAMKLTRLFPMWSSSSRLRPMKLDSSSRERWLEERLLWDKVMTNILEKHFPDSCAYSSKTSFSDIPFRHHVVCYFFVP